MRSPSQCRRLQAEPRDRREKAVALDPAAERIDLLPRRESTATTPSKSLSVERVHSGHALLPPGGRTLVQRSRSDLQDLLEWEEGQQGQDGVSRMPRNLCPGAGPETSSPDQQRRLLPAGLLASLLGGAACMLTLQRAMVQELLGSSLVFTCCAGGVYGVTLAFMAYVGLADPGQVGDALFARWQEVGDGALPRRAHKSWLYARPILRFDHYCRWLGNCIGLMNHREFLAMTWCLASIAVLSASVDSALLLARTHAIARSASGMPLRPRPTDALLMLHLAYSMVFARYVVPILRLHLGFVLRNELAKEWKDDAFYVVHDAVSGASTPVNELDVEDYNKNFEVFQYEGTRNPFDGGWRKNCWVFWCTPRRAAGQLGDF
mmetsp:Transcript_25560/g.73806  ORF Transcript_25560/g.73806 Transcript_25560/m.73806 type:complete len:377 (-) Transcript_25560:146-1276(-)